MRFKKLNGKLIYKNCNKYKINWEKNEKSKFQTNVKLFLKPYIYNHIVYSEFPCFGTLLKIDIFDATTKIAYEISGEQHQKYNKFFQKTRLNYLNQIKRDLTKAKFCDINNIILIEIFPSDLPLSYQFFIDTYGIYL